MDQLPSATELRTRFILPFYFETSSWPAVLDGLSRATILGRSGAWEVGEPYEYYTDELLPQASQFLFACRDGSSPGDTVGCRYYRLHNDVRNRLFKDAEFDSCVGVRRVRLTDHAPIELFISPAGVGFLSLSLHPSGDASRSFLLDFNYRLSSLDRRAQSLRNRHPRDDAEQWARIPPERQAAIPAAPPEDDPVEARVGAPGGGFFVREVCELLLAPLAPFASSGLTTARRSLSVYTVARFPEAVDFGLEPVRREVGPLLASSAQLEEYRHAGVSPDDLGVPEERLNRRHWCASSAYGTAHFVSDQPVGADEQVVEFNNERVSRVFHKYFVPHALALLQRMVVEHTGLKAAQLIARPVEEYAAELPALRHRLLEFALAGAFEQLSMRHAVQRSFRIVQKALETREIGERVRHGIAELDAKLAADQRRLLAERGAAAQESAAKTQRSALRTQHVAEQLEVVIVAVYLAEFWHIFSTHEGGVHVWHFNLLGVALLGGLATWLYLHRPWSKAHHDDEH